MDLNFLFLSCVLVSILTLGSCKPNQKIKNQKSITMSKPTKGSLNDWKPKKPKGRVHFYLSNWAPSISFDKNELNCSVRERRPLHPCLALQVQTMAVSFPLRYEILIKPWQCRNQAQAVVIFSTWTESSPAAPHWTETRSPGAPRRWPGRGRWRGGGIVTTPVQAWLPHNPTFTPTMHPGFVVTLQPDI